MRLPIHLPPHSVSKRDLWIECYTAALAGGRSPADASKIADESIEEYGKRFGRNDTVEKST
jgi:hypothetical protein